MLQTYLAAENLKFKRTLFRKLILYIPAALILIAVIFLSVGIGLGGFSASIVCNWCVPIASLSIVILCHLVNNKEQKHNYRTIYSLPIDLKNTFISKSILIALNLLLISLLLSFISIISEYMMSGVLSAFKHTGSYVLGYCLLWLTLLWQIPFCLFLDQKAGFVGSMIINLIFTGLGGLFLSLSTIFWFIPYSWTARFMITLFGVLPNGLLVQGGTRQILSLGQSSLLVVVSMLTAVVLTFLFAHWYRGQVYRN